MRKLTVRSLSYSTRRCRKNTTWTQTPPDNLAAFPFVQNHRTLSLVLQQEMSYNNYLDADAAWNCVNEFPDPTAVVVKHTNPCGVASSKDDLLEAYRLAVRADPVSAFGGIVAFNVPVDEVRVCFRVLGFGF